MSHSKKKKKSHCECMSRNNIDSGKVLERGPWRRNINAL